MFYQFGTEPYWIDPESISGDALTVGYIKSDELPDFCEKFGFSASTAEACRTPTEYFRSGVEIYPEYTFTELRIIDADNDDEDCVALYIKKNLLLVVDVDDKDGSTKEKFMSAVKRYAPKNVTLEKIIYAFFDALVSPDIKKLEEISNDISELEGQIHDENVDDDFNTVLFKKKKLLLKLHYYYEQILDITEAIDENENDIFDSNCLMYISNITKKVERLREDADSLKNTAEHLQDAHSAYLDIKLNDIMKFFTVITSIFFPLTIIVGWYGMNFQGMPELQWRYGYIYVIALSVITAGILAIIGKRKKWY